MTELPGSRRLMFVIERKREKERKRYNRERLVFCEIGLLFTGGGAGRAGFDGGLRDGRRNRLMS